MNQTVVSLAILKANWDQRKKDYLDNFVPFAVECLRMSTEPVVSIPTVQEQLTTKFGLTIPQTVVQALVTRLKRQGYIYAENGVYRPDHERLNSSTFHQVQQSVLLTHETVTKELIEFACKQHDLEWSFADAENALSNYLDHFQFQTLEVSKRVEGVREQQQLSNVRSEAYIVGDFVQSLIYRDSALLEYFETILKGHMLSQAFFLVNPGHESRRFSNTQIYFDSPLMIYALGYAGEPRQAPVRELIQLAKEVGAQLCCFRHSVEEARGSLNACATAIGKNQLQKAYGPSIDYFVQHGKSESDILLQISHLEQDINRLGINVIDKPNYKEHQGVIGEDDLRSVLDEKIGYQSPRALDRDVESIAAVYRLRKNKSYSYVEDCLALFITANNGLVDVVRKQSKYEQEDGTVPVCFSDYQFTTLLWLKKPNEAPTLPRKRLIAACYAATQPDNALWGKYQQEIDALQKDSSISSEQYYVLRHDLFARAELMRLTKGDDGAFTQGTVSEILKHRDEHIRTTAKVESEEKLKQVERERDELQNKFAEEQAAKLKQQQQHEQQEQERIAKLKARAAREAKWAKNVATIMAVTLLLVSLALTSPLGPDLALRELNSLTLVLFVIQIGMLILGLINMMWGTTLQSFITRFEQYMYEKRFNQMNI